MCKHREHTSIGNIVFLYYIYRICGDRRSRYNFLHEFNEQQKENQYKISLNQNTINLIERRDCQIFSIDNRDDQHC